MNDVLFYSVVRGQAEKVVEFFLERGTAEVMICEVRSRLCRCTPADTQPVTEQLEAPTGYPLQAAEATKKARPPLFAINGKAGALERGRQGLCVTESDMRDVL